MSEAVTKLERDQAVKYRAFTASHVVFVLLGLLLITAGLLKVFGTNSTAYAEYGWLHSESIRNAVVIWEFILGGLLLFNYYRSIAWYCATLTFFAFLLVSLWLIVLGQANCRCFGAIKTSPWIALSVDVCALSLLFAMRPKLTLRSDYVDLTEAIKTYRLALISFFAIFCATSLVAYFIYGSFGSALARLRGDKLVYEQFIDYGTGTSGVTIEQEITVMNYSDEPIKLVGGTSDCSCVMHLSLPVTINPGQSERILIAIKPQGDSGLFTRKATVYTDSKDIPRLSFTLSVIVTPPVSTKEKT
jgi:hypothetical protein